MPLLDHEDQDGQPDGEGDPRPGHGQLDDHVVPVGEVPDVAHVGDVALVPKAIIAENINFTEIIKKLLK